MSSVRTYHDQAMELAQRAMIARDSGDTPRWIEFSREAYEWELKAAALVEIDPRNEPTRSILYRSAASLAIDANLFREAERCIAQAYIGDPPFDVRSDLAELAENLRFQEGLLTRGFALQSGELELHMEGQHIGYGMVPYREFVKRSEKVVLLLERTADRLEHIPYQPDRRSSRHRQYEPIIATPDAASFAVKFRLAEYLDQPQSLFSSANEVIDEIVTGVNHLMGGDESSLKTQIQDDHYYLNFISLAKELAPDGKKITSVSLATQDKSANFTRTSKEIPLEKPAETTDESDLDQPIIGLLVAADARSGKGKVVVQSEGNQELTLSVKEGLDDVVRAHFYEYVIVHHERVGRSNRLISVESYDG